MPVVVAEGGEPSPRDELAELGRRVQSGDERALGQLLRELAPHLLRAARRVLGPGHPYLEDVAHDAAYAVVERLSEFRGESTLLNFARRFAVLTAMNARRRDTAKKRARLRDAMEPDALTSDALDPEQRVSTDSFLPVVRELLDSLPEQLAEAFALQVILGYSVEEIAGLTSAPHETVRSRLRLAKQALRQRALAHPVLRQAAEGSDDR